MFFYGLHTCYHALQNRARSVSKIYIVDDGKRAPLGLLEGNRHLKKVEVVPPSFFKKTFPEGTLHQGVAIDVAPLPNSSPFDEAFSSQTCFVVLDQVTDPYNVGAILRSCCVFGAKALIMTKAHAPKESAVMAKAASGALEYVPLCYVANISSTLASLKEEGFWVYGFSEKGDRTLGGAPLDGKSVLVFGSEGSGMRRLTSTSCDVHVRVPFSSSFSTLNVSNTVAVALYEVLGRSLVKNM